MFRHLPIYNKALGDMPDDFSAVYRCPGCHRFYASAELARECSETNEKLGAKPGDIIKIDVGYGWWDGADHWMIFNTGDHHGTPTHSAYFVVTAITHYKHEARYSVKTLGIKNGNPTGLCGWSGGGHKIMRAVKNPDPRLVEEGKPYIGEVYDNLI